ncbi:tyrosine-type recombinase/integrase [Mesorhizobium sp.]|uniref:tyrosine-type recombinase/integrase n=1 Tax=Mesorhizobium sp. TaxID=1871066 RepID=UPI0025E4072D|nr:tyrosine-type recombinase/integrase [Mesorhizobium sp.]
MTAFARFLGEKAERYIELRHSLGYAFSKQAGTLRAFVRYVERAQLVAPATRTMALDFALSFGGAANSRVTRHGVLRQFYEYLAVYDVRTEALERRAFPRSRAITPPRILTDAELASLIDACARISPSTPLRGRTTATLIGLLASSGLRSGEVVKLDRSDVDLANGVLLVRKTKFRKDRLVTVHTTTQTALRQYVRERDAAFPTPKDQAFFLSSRGTLIAVPDLKTPRGRRDRAFLLFLARTGGRVSEATGVNANDLQLERPHPQVLLRGKGRRDRVVPIAKDLARALTTLLSERDRPSRTATDIRRRPQRAPDSFRSDPYRAACGRRGRGYQAGLGRQAHIAAHLPALSTPPDYVE